MPWKMDANFANLLSLPSIVIVKKVHTGRKNSQGSEHLHQPERHYCREFWALCDHRACQSWTPSGRLLRQPACPPLSEHLWAIQPGSMNWIFTKILHSLSVYNNNDRLSTAAGVLIQRPTEAFITHTHTHTHTQAQTHTHTHTHTHVHTQNWLYTPFTHTLQMHALLVKG